MEWGIGVARRGWVVAGDVINCWAVEELLGFLGKRG
jgi:hypothetical protein